MTHIFKATENRKISRATQPKIKFSCNPCPLYNEPHKTFLPNTKSGQKRGEECGLVRDYIKQRAK